MGTLRKLLHFVTLGFLFSRQSAHVNEMPLPYPGTNYGHRSANHGKTDFYKTKHGNSPQAKAKRKRRHFAGICNQWVKGGTNSWYSKRKKI